MTPKRLGRRTAGWVRSAVVAVAAAIVAGALGSAPVPAATLAGPPVITRAFAGPAVGVVFISWGKASDGGSPVTTYGFSVSVNAGTTWTAVRSFASKNLTQSTTTFPALVCTNTAPGSQGCLFRIYAKNILGFGPPSKPVALWTAPSAPRSLEADADAGFTTTTLLWRPPASSGGLIVTGYDVLGSMDGAATTLLTTVRTLSAAVPCTAKRTCTYSVRATNSHGRGPVSASAAVTPAPGPVQAMTLQNTGSNAATGRSDLILAWRKPLTGLDPDHYDVQQCGFVIGQPASCGATSTGWTGAVELFPTPGVPMSSNATCQSGFATCLMRVRAVNGRGGAGPWRAIDLEPWSPYGITVTPGSQRGFVTVEFRGPTESGHTGPGTKHYRVIVCDTNCGLDAAWHTASDAVPYPPAGTAPYLAGAFQCRATATAPPSRCRVRMQFVDGLGNPGILSAIASGNEHP